ncbi:PRC-barrel domain protein [Methanobrevibacter cuticularis]|uniref:PRC-barrel domain protein n=1 Tax=Methanobrevibacter cuticularis TaxID=47311 RepID=A0A166F6C7_9EURY|nr:PRC-barrel domain-containing protein [Methanobrevibacter cuticularis]KZX17361.1 PRC-barrel domain protein [Methanobrevibacter cuticularis]
MRVIDLIGKIVVDREGNTIGLVEDIDIDEKQGYIKKVDIDLNPKLFSKEKKSINFDQIQDISYSVLLHNIIDLG